MSDDNRQQDANKTVTITLLEKLTSPPLQCAFIHAPDPLYADTQNYGALFMPVWAYTLAAHIPMDGRYELHLCDTRFDAL